MTKKNTLTIILETIFIVAFNLLFFLNGGVQRVSSVWICYGFLHFSYFMILITPFICAKGSTAILSKTSTYTISIIYFFIQLVFTIVVIFANVDKRNLVLSCEIIVAAIYLIVLIINLLADDSTETKQTLHETENAFIKKISNHLKYIESLAQDNDVKNKIESVYYLAHSSPTKSNSNVKNYEDEIVKNIDFLEDAANKNEIENITKLCTEIEKLLSKRNFDLR